MNHICLGYIVPGKFEGMTEDERNATIQQIAIGKWQLVLRSTVNQ
jgi:hypothetical protein